MYAGRWMHFPPPPPPPPHTPQPPPPHTHFNCKRPPIPNDQKAKSQYRITNTSFAKWNNQKSIVWRGSWDPRLHPPLYNRQYDYQQTLNKILRPRVRAKTSKIGNTFALVWKLNVTKSFEHQTGKLLLTLLLQWASFLRFSTCSFHCFQHGGLPARLFGPLEGGDYKNQLRPVVIPGRTIDWLLTETISARSENGNPFLMGPSNIGPNLSAGKNINNSRLRPLGMCIYH